MPRLSPIADTSSYCLVIYFWSHVHYCVIACIRQSHAHMIKAGHNNFHFARINILVERGWTYPWGVGKFSVRLFGFIVDGSVNLGLHGNMGLFSTTARLKTTQWTHTIKMKHQHHIWIEWIVLTWDWLSWAVLATSAPVVCTTDSPSIMRQPAKMVQLHF